MSPVYKFSNAGGFTSKMRYTSMLAGNPWEPQGAYDSLATVTVPSGGLASVTFAGIPAGYTHLEIRYIARCTTSNQNMSMRINTDTGANYAWHYLSGNGSTTSAGGGATQSSAILPIAANATNCVTAGVINILDYTSSNKFKTIKTLSGYDQNGSGDMALLSGLWMNTTAITSLTFNLSASFAQYTQFALYGIK